MSDVEEEGGEKTPLWMIIYTDMITNLMIFFMMSYCLTWLSEQDRKVAAASLAETFGGKKNEIVKTMQEIKNQEQQRVREEQDVEHKVIDKFSNVEINEEVIKITLPSPVLFDSGKADLKKETYPALHEISEMVRNLPNKMVVEGHTDDKPIKTKEFQSNWELSASRAFSVIRYFIEKEHLNPQKLSAYGYGEFRPIKPNDSEENRKINRRIEMNIIKIK